MAGTARYAAHSLVQVKASLVSSNGMEQAFASYAEFPGRCTRGGVLVSFFGESVLAAIITSCQADYAFQPGYGVVVIALYYLSIYFQAVKG